MAASFSDLSKRVECITDAAYTVSNIAKGREVYVPLALLHEIIEALDMAEKIQSAKIVVDPIR